MDINVSIILVSQSDRLTKVRGSLSTFQQRYWLYSLGGRGGEVEENPQAALAGTMAETEEALNGSAAVEFSERENPGVLLKTLRTNIDNPEQAASQRMRRNISCKSKITCRTLVTIPFDSEMERRC